VRVLERVVNEIVADNCLQVVKLQTRTHLENARATAGERSDIVSFQPTILLFG
jgi:hypothetical protein